MRPSPPYRQAVALDPENPFARNGLRVILVRLGRADEARAAWQKALQANPPRHDDWYGYAEFCLFLGREAEYRSARKALLTRFGAATDPPVEERTARACLLLPVSGDELRQAVALAERAVAVEPSRHQGVSPYFLFAQGLPEYRQGRFDRAISVMRGDARQVLGPAPRLVLAMALHRSGQVEESRQALVAAVLAHDWSASQVSNPNDWIFHVLRREAEALILPNLPVFLDGKYQPQNNDERLARLGVCQFTNRSYALARLYAEAFAAAPQLAEDVRAGHRFRAARAAAQAGSGRGEDGASLSREERTRWRKQARAWLEFDLAAWARKLGSDTAADRVLVGQRLSEWLADPDLAGLRELGALDELSVEEREERHALWKKVGALVQRATGP